MPLEEPAWLCLASKLTLVASRHFSSLLSIFLYWLYTDFGFVQIFKELEKMKQKGVKAAQVLVLLQRMLCTAVLFWNTLIILINDSVPSAKMSL